MYIFMVGGYLLVYIRVDVAVLMYIGMVGGYLFVILQLILLVDFAHSWNSVWCV